MDTTKVPLWTLTEVTVSTGKYIVDTFSFAPVTPVRPATSLQSGDRICGSLDQI
jgi:hypothetical protein